MLDNMISWSVTRKDESLYNSPFSSDIWSFAAAVFKDAVAVIIRSGNECTSPIDDTSDAALKAGIWTVDFTTGCSLHHIADIDTPLIFMDDIKTEESLRKACVSIKQYFDSSKEEILNIFHKKETAHAQETIWHFYNIAAIRN